MRIALLAIVSSISLAAAAGCAPRFTQSEPQPTLASPPPTFGQTEQQPSLYERSLNAVQSSTTQLVAWAKPEPHVVPATDELSLSSTKHQDTPELHVSMAKLLEKQGEFGRAEKHYQDGLMLAPGDGRTLLAYAHLLDRQGRFDEAMQRYEQAASALPGEARVHNDLGLCLARQQRLDESLSSLATAVQMSPQKALYRNNIATVLVEVNRPEEAWQHLKAVHPPAVAHYNFAFLLVKKGDHGAAFQHFAHAARLDPAMTAARQWADRLQSYSATAPLQATPPRQTVEASGPRLDAPQSPQATARYPEQPPYRGQAPSADRRYNDYYRPQHRFYNP